MLVDDPSVLPICFCISSFFLSDRLVNQGGGDMVRLDVGMFELMFNMA